MKKARNSTLTHLSALCACFTTPALLVHDSSSCQTPDLGLGLGVDFSFDWDYNNNKHKVLIDA